MSELKEIRYSFKIRTGMKIYILIIELINIYYCICDDKYNTKKPILNELISIKKNRISLYIHCCT